MERRIGMWLAIGLGLLLSIGSAFGQSRSEALARWRARQSEAVPAAPLPADTRVVRDVAYGSDPRQRFDVYAPPHAHGAPVLVMVHGGGWRRGDKAMPGVTSQDSSTGLRLCWGK